MESLLKCTHAQKKEEVASGPVYNAKTNFQKDARISFTRWQKYFKIQRRCNQQKGVNFLNLKF